MTYSAHNSGLFDAMLDGAMGGMTEKQISASTNKNYAKEQTSLAQVAVAADAFAQSLDTLIAPIEGGSSVQQNNLMRTICHAWWAQRNPLSNPQYASPAFYTPMATAVKTVFEAAQTYLQTS